MYKYKIWELLQQLPLNQHNKAKKRIPELLGVSQSTFNRWMYYKFDSYESIPADSLYQIATFFDVEIKEMWNKTPNHLHHEYLKIRQDFYSDFD